jgi:hypothetical protein
MPLPLKVRKDIKDHEATRDQHLAAIKALTGEAYTLVVDFDKIYDAVGASDTFADRLGWLVYSERLGGLVSQMQKIVAGSGWDKPNDLFPGELNAFVTSRKIFF